MSDSSARAEDVERIRGLLFGKELQLLQDLALKLKEHDEKVGSEARLTACISKALADALRLADVQDHNSLATALAPAIIETVRREIWNSKETLVQALYPMTGQLVSAYVAEGISKLLNKTDNRLRSWFSLKRTALRMKSLFSGIPYRKLKLLYQLGVRLEQVLVVKRGAGIIASEWTEKDTLQQEAGKTTGPHMVASMLAAINEFANEALASESGTLRALDLGPSHVHLRATPAYIVAVKCSGRRNPELDPHVDIALKGALERVLLPLGDSPTAGEAEKLSGLAANIALRLETSLLDADLILGSSTGRSPVFAYALVGWLGLLGMGLIGTATVKQLRQDALKQRIVSIIKENRNIAPSQVRVSLSNDGQSVQLSGVLPSQKVADELSKNIIDAVGNVSITQQFLFAIPPDVISNLVAQTERTILEIASLKAQMIRYTLDSDKVEQVFGDLTASRALLRTTINPPSAPTITKEIPSVMLTGDKVIVSALASLSKFDDVPNRR